MSDLYAPRSGPVLEINDPLADNPEPVNEDCYGEGWLVKVKITNPKDLNDLMDHTAYQAFVKEETV